MPSKASQAFESRTRSQERSSAPVSGLAVAPQSWPRSPSSVPQRPPDLACLFRSIHPSQSVRAIRHDLLLSLALFLGRMRRDALRASLRSATRDLSLVRLRLGLNLVSL